MSNQTIYQIVKEKISETKHWSTDPTTVWSNDSHEIYIKRDSRGQLRVCVSGCDNIQWIATNFSQVFNNDIKAYEKWVTRVKVAMQ